MWFDSEILSIIRDVVVWIVDFDTTWGHVTSLSDMSVPTHLVILGTERSHFQGTPLYKLGCIKNDYWEEPLEELDEIYRLYINDLGIQRENVLWGNELGGKFLPRLGEWFQRVDNDEKAILLKNLGSLLHRTSGELLTGLR